jgi:AcrR family transcriptional regulator
MSTLRMTSDLRRELILGAAKRCFARHGFAGTTTKSVAAAASISEALLFKHFPTKSALYAEILAEECEADPALHKLLGLAPSTETLVVLVRGMVGHFLDISDAPDQEEDQRLRLMVTSHLDDGEFARLLYEKIGRLIGPAFTASLEQAAAAGDASKGWARAAESVLVCASHRADGGAVAASRGSVFVLCQRRRSRTAALRVYSPRNWTQ